jgi:type I restriction enzyme S subunit
VRPGYKQTEVGVIPEEWEAQPLGRSCEIITKGTTPTSIGREFTNTGVTFLKAESISESGRTIPDKVAFIDDATHALLKRSQLSEGDVLISIAGVLGRVGLVEKADLPANTNQALAVVRLGKNAELLRGFLFYCLRSSIVSEQIRDITVQAAQANISLQNVRDFLLPLPSTKAEQETIAEALSDADALIESLEQLLTKKRLLKQGAMQELLTGKKRLAGFSGEWEVKRLDELGRWTGGMTPSMRNPDYWQAGTVPWISSGDVKSVRLTTTAFAISIYAVKQRVTTLLPAKSIIVVTRSGILRNYLPVAMNMIPMAINQDIKALLTNDHVLPEYLLHSLTCIGDRILARCLKSGTTVESIEFPWLKAFTIPIPTLLEQTAIADILSDMDGEIVALEAKLAKTQSIKQGMMQELLTGRIRLV